MMGFARKAIYFFLAGAVLAFLAFIVHEEILHPYSVALYPPSGDYVAPLTVSSTANKGNLGTYIEVMAVSAFGEPSTTKTSMVVLEEPGVYVVIAYAIFSGRRHVQAGSDIKVYTITPEKTKL